MNIIYDDEELIAYKPITNTDEAFYKEDGTVGTALKDDWWRYVDVGSE